jgi:hypothetical protein
MAGGSGKYRGWAKEKKQRQNLDWEFVVVLFFFASLDKLWADRAAKTFYRA